LLFRDDALKAATRALRQQNGGVGEAIAKPKQVAFGAPQQRFQPRAPLHEGLIAKVAALQLQQVEGVNAHGHMPAVEEHEEIGPCRGRGSEATVRAVAVIPPRCAWSPSPWSADPIRPFRKHAGKDAEPPMTWGGRRLLKLHVCVHDSFSLSNWQSFVVNPSRAL
jgi:hypothetical protein